MHFQILSYGKKVRLCIAWSQCENRPKFGHLQKIISNTTDNDIKILFSDIYIEDIQGSILIHCSGLQIDQRPFSRYFKIRPVRV